MSFFSPRYSGGDSSTQDALQRIVGPWATLPTGGTMEQLTWRWHYEGEDDSESYVIVAGRHVAGDLYKHATLTWREHDWRQDEDPSFSSGLDVLDAESKRTGRAAGRRLGQRAWIFGEWWPDGSNRDQLRLLIRPAPGWQLVCDFFNLTLPPEEVAAIASQLSGSEK